MEGRDFKFRDYQKTNPFQNQVIRGVRIIRSYLDQYLDQRDSQCCIGGEFKRIYFYHVRKTAGTSINHMFLATATDHPNTAYQQISKTLLRRITLSGKTFVAHNRILIRQGNYFYAYSHSPVHLLRPSSDTFTFTCFRDPVERVISHYKMLLEIQQETENHPMLNTECKWLGNSFSDFLQNIPQEHLLNQLYMFSKTFDVPEAVSEASKLNHIVFSDQFEQGISALVDKTGVPLTSSHIRKSSIKLTLTDADRARLREMLDAEYELLRLLKTAEADKGLNPGHE